MFTLHPRLAADTHPVADWPLCRVLLMNDARYHWLILVPMREGIREIHELEPEELQQLMAEITAASKALCATVPQDKINVGALGNMVPQLHIHVIARRIGDAAWPGPVWGNGTAVPYAEGEVGKLADRLREALGGHFAAIT
ncbi:MAG TPA: HIT family protein [Mariprofundaceae bacterium]|nr:HIT family protein [Mariprofundaceae bacterium]